MYIPRYIEESIINTYNTFKVLYLSGPRQVGKTTLLLHIAKKFNIHYVTLDDISQRDLAKKDPELFLQQFDTPLLIDEAQYAPELFPYIKIRVDANQQNGQYWLTSSQQFSMLKEVQESLAGRVGILQLLGFSAAEVARTSKLEHPFPHNISTITAPTTTTQTINTLFQKIHRGGFPALWADNPPEQDLFFRSYLQTYIDRDLVDIFGIRKVSEFHTFLQLCAARTGQVLNISDIARDAAISVHAAKEWISILESTHLIYLLRPYYSNLSKRLVKAPKLYFLDTGFAAYLTKWSTPETLQNGAMSGAIFETFVMSELIKSYLFRGKEIPLYYFRDAQGHEVDLLIEEDQIFTPIEIKKGSRITEHDLRHIQFLRERNSQVTNGIVVSLTPHQQPITAQDRIIPAWMIQ